LAQCGGDKGEMSYTM